MKKLIPLILVFSFSVLTGHTQQSDTTKTLLLNEIIIQEKQTVSEIDRMPELKENVLYAGKKTEVIQLDKINADLSINNTRQIFAKVPGISIWENESSGIQIGVSVRGLSPNRSWEFNVRQNGYDISSEPFGYPETYYTPPMEALRKIEVIRGAASLQFGPQFGGLLNYQIKQADKSKPVSFETSQTIGSYALFNTFNALGLTSKKASFYGFLHQRSAEGWRENNRYSILTGYISANYQISNKITLSGEYTNMNYKSQQPGGLTDAQFADNPRQSLRERNWFGAPFSVASITLKYEITAAINIQLKTFATFAERNSVGFTKSITTKDSINPATLQYSARQVDRDKYQNYGAEIRTSIRYLFLGNEHIFAGGIRIYTGKTKRNQLGTGTTGNDFDLTLTLPQYGRALSFETNNFAAFAENVFHIGKNLKLVPGFRLEYIENNRSGYINTTQTGTLPNDNRIRKFLLYGLGSEYRISEKTNIYANYSLAYRPVTFSELTPSATTEIIDPNLKDASGYNADLGYRGTVNNYLSFDIGVFLLHYNNRIGIISQNGVPFKTNIGTSESKGVESYIEINPFRIFTENSKIGTLSFFASNAFINAKYIQWNNPAVAQNPATSIENNRVENAPKFIHRFGATYNLMSFSATFQINSVGDVFTDAENSETPNATATTGRLSGYEVMDLACSYKFKKNYSIKAGVNNLANEKYATRRAGGYPGPGILPANGRTVFITLSASF